MRRDNQYTSTPNGQSHKVRDDRFPPYKREITFFSFYLFPTTVIGGLLRNVSEGLNDLFQSGTFDGNKNRNDYVDKELNKLTDV